MTPIRRTQENEARLLTPSDIERPLEYEELVDAANILTEAGQDPDDTAQEAVGFYRRKEMQRLIGNATFNASRLAERLERLEERLPHEIEESDLLQNLVNDLLEAKETLSAKDSRLPDIFGFRARRKQHERLEALREKAAIDGMIGILDLREGDEITLTSKLWEIHGKAKSVLSGKIIGRTETDIGPALLLRVKKEKRTGNAVFTTAERQRGAVTRLAGTVFWSNQYRMHPSHISQGDALEFIDVEGKPYVNAASSMGERHGVFDRPLGLSLRQLTVNGTDIFPDMKKG